ncbi:MAG: chaperone protein HscB [Segetibacter sp.]|jgi:molecular chaperone HscB|nr:chaperone protein HscB [Segetibacter sp.]
MTHFELYAIPVTLQPDQHSVKQKFYELSRKYHPDFYTQENEYDQSEALEISSQVNKAYKVFQSRDETIKYVLQLRELLEEEEKYALPPDFLMEMLELNEQMMEAKMEEDAAAIAKLKETIAGIEEEIYQPVKTIVEGYEEGKTTTEDLLKVKEYYYKKKYLSRILATMLR